MDHNVCVILPCAGKGTRLALPFPKELFPLGPNEALIDSCLAVLAASKKKIRIVVVINHEKLETIKYLKKYNNQFELIFIFQKDNLEEFAGAVRSAQHLFLDYNFVLLPDTIIKYDHPEKDIVEDTVSLLAHNDMVFWAKPESDPLVLMREGCLVIENKGLLKVVKEYEDKPTERFDRFHAVWSAFAFRYESWRACLDVMESSIKKLDNRSENNILIGSPIIEIDESIDLGTWEAIVKLYRVGE